MKKILFQGDSITDVHRNRAESNSADTMGCGYPLLIKARLGLDRPNDFEFVNRGVSGDRVVDVYARIKRDIINIAPDYLSILIGVNDVWHGLGADPNGVDAPKFEMVYDLLLAEIRAALPATRIIILEPFVLPGTATVDETRPELWAEFSREVPLRAQAARRVAEKHGAAFIPLQDKLDKACELAPAGHWLRDGVHPTEAGHELIAREWVETFGRVEG